MIHSLSLTNYRGFDTYRLEGLGPVNLIVGKNNSGKTSVLEAVHFLASGGDPSVLAQIALLRGETVFFGEDTESLKREAPEVSHFFWGHSLDLGSEFSIGADNGLSPLTVRVIQAKLVSESQQRLFDRFGESAAAFSLRVGGGANGEGEEPDSWLVSEEGALLELVYPYHRPRRMRHKAGPSIQYIAPESLEPRSMSDMWDRVLAEGRESEVIEAMRILEGDIADIVFLTGANARRASGQGGILAGFRNTKGRLPLGSLGEGIRRLLALSLSLIHSADGILLIDEIDTGLHWGVMQDMWQLVVRTAMDSNVQVFATTHSLDCLRGLAWLHESDPDVAQHVMVQKLDRNLKESVAFDTSQVHTAVEQEIELR
ncbi:MAG: AAA family ATPase [Candidatus Hydrogenedentota bacterium]